MEKMVNKEELKKMREGLYQKARNYRIEHIVKDLETYHSNDEGNLCGIINGENKFLWANECLTNEAGWSNYELISKPLQRLIHKDDLNKINKLYKSKDSSNSIDVRLKTKGGEINKVSWKILFNKDKGCLYCYEI